MAVGQAIYSPLAGFAAGIETDATVFTTDSVLGALGFRRFVGNLEVIQQGTPRDTWSFSAGSVSAFVDPQVTGGGGTGGGSIVYASVSYTSTSASILAYLTDGSSSLLSLDFAISFVAENVFQIATLVTNLTGSPVTVKARRFVDFDVPSATSLFTRNIDVVDPFADIVVATSYGGAPGVLSGPLQEKVDTLEAFIFPAPAAGGTLGTPGFATSYDLGAGLDVLLGTLGAGQSRTVYYLYGLTESGQSESSLRSQLAGLGSVCTITTRSGNTVGTVNTAAMGVYASSPPSSSSAASSASSSAPPPPPEQGEVVLWPDCPCCGNSSSSSGSSSPSSRSSGAPPEEESEESSESSEESSGEAESPESMSEVSSSPASSQVSSVSSVSSQGSSQASSGSPQPSSSSSGTPPATDCCPGITALQLTLTITNVAGCACLAGTYILTWFQSEQRWRYGVAPGSCPINQAVQFWLRCVEGGTTCNDMLFTGFCGTAPLAERFANDRMPDAGCFCNGVLSLTYSGLTLAGICCHGTVTATITL